MSRASLFFLVLFTAAAQAEWVSVSVKGVMVYDPSLPIHASCSGTVTVTHIFPFPESLIAKASVIRTADFPALSNGAWDYWGRPGAEWGTLSLADIRESNLVEIDFRVKCEGSRRSKHVWFRDTVDLRELEWLEDEGMGGKETIYRQDRGRYEGTRVKIHYRLVK